MLKPLNSNCMLIPLMGGTKQVGILSARGPYDNKTTPQDQLTCQEGIGIDPGLSTVTRSPVTIMALATPKEDS